MAAGTKEVEARRPYESMAAELANLAATDSSVDNGQTAFELAAQAIDRIATAKTAEDIFAANETGAGGDAKDYVGVNINCERVDYAKSDQKYAKGSLGVFVIIHGFKDSGEVIEPPITCGAPNVVASIRQAQRIGLIGGSEPFRFTFTAKDTANGTLLRVGAPK